jgi:hypothetical protein
VTIHIATVHWGTDRWIEPQLRYFDRYVDQPYRVYTFLDKVPSAHAEKFFYTSKENVGDHAAKLNLLADIIRFNADPSDVVMFIDGDAWPIAPIAPLIRERMEPQRLIAVQRYENNADIQPHPCFCLTTVGLWHEIGGDWHPGYTWFDPQGVPVTDVGGNLLEAVERAGIDWYPLRRVNRVDPHPVFFGVYGDDTYGGVVYHHGAAFRPGGLTRADFVTDEFREVAGKPAARLLDRLPKHGALGQVRRRYDPISRWKRDRLAEATRNSERFIGQLERGEEFWRDLV